MNIYKQGKKGQGMQGEKKVMKNNEKKKLRIIDKRFRLDDEGIEIELPKDEHLKTAYVKRLEEEVRLKDGLIERYINLLRTLREESERSKERMKNELEKRIEVEMGTRIEPFLEILDDLERTVEIPDNSRDPDSLIKGVEMIIKRFRDILKESGVTQIKAEGEPFDPQFHEAIDTVPVEKRDEDNMVVEEVRKGYKMGNRLIRPSKVKVGRFKEKG
jgi:molecular chaperone GrpE (heat shock protein)